MIQEGFPTFVRSGKCRRHWIIVASYAETPLGVSNQRSLFAKRGKVNGWLGRYTYNPLLLCKGHDEACRKPKGLHFYISISYPAISLPSMGQLHSWLLSSDAYGICYASVVTCVLANKSKFARTRAIRGKQQIETSPTNKKSPMPKHRGLLLNRSGLQFLS